MKILVHDFWRIHMCISIEYVSKIGIAGLLSVPKFELPRWFNQFTYLPVLYQIPIALFVHNQNFHFRDFGY